MCSRVLTRRLSLLGLAATIGCLTAGLGGTANAVQLGYEPFKIGADPLAGEYTLGGLNTQNPTTAFFNGAWVGTTGTGFGTLLDTQAVSATKPGQLHPSIGGSVAPGDQNFDSGFGNGPGPYTGSVSERAMRPLATAWDLTTEQTYWVGFLIGYGKQGGVTGYRAWEMWNDTVDTGGDGNPANGADDPQRTLQLGYSGGFGDFNNGVDPYDGNKLSARIGNAGSTSKQLTPGLDIIADDGAVNCIAIKFDLHTARNGDSVSIWVNPMGTDEAALPAPDAAFSGIEFLANLMGSEAQFMFETNSTLPGSQGIYDELRIGTTFADVACMVPEPATVSLFGLGALGLVLAARRKRA